MTKEQILKKAIEKAIKNGYKFEYAICSHGIFDGGKGEYGGHLNELEELALIYSHDFAKAFWGEKDEWHTTKCDCGGIDFHIDGYDKHYGNCAKVKSNRDFRYHLQQMVLEKEPLKYLEKFL